MPDQPATSNRYLPAMQKRSTAELLLVLQSPTQFTEEALAAAVLKGRGEKFEEVARPVVVLIHLSKM